MQICVRLLGTSRSYPVSFCSISHQSALHRSEWHGEKNISDPSVPGTKTKKKKLLKIPKGSKVYIILEWKSFLTVRTPPVAGCPTIQSNTAGGKSLRETAQNSMVTLAEPKRSCVQMGEFMRERDLCSTAKHFQKSRMSLRHSTNLGLMEAAPWWKTWKLTYSVQLED